MKPELTASLSECQNPQASVMLPLGGDFFFLHIVPPPAAAPRAERTTFGISCEFSGQLHSSIPWCMTAPCRWQVELAAFSSVEGLLHKHPLPSLGAV